MHSGNASYDIHGFSLGNNALRYDMDLICLSWLEHYLRGVEMELTAHQPWSITPWAPTSGKPQRTGLFPVHRN